MRKLSLVLLLMASHTWANDKAASDAEMQYKAHIDNLIPVATRLYAECGQGNSESCKQAESLLHLLRFRVTDASGAEKLSNEEQQELITEVFKAIAASVISTSSAYDSLSTHFKDAACTLPSGEIDTDCKTK